jgi:hypothetical protein
LQTVGTNTVGRVIIQKLSTISKIEKNGSILMLPIQISNVQMINIYNQHQNIREEVNKRVEEKFKLNFEVDTYVHPNIGVHIINKTDELINKSARKTDVDEILNREIKVQTNKTSVTFFVDLGEFFDDLVDDKSPLFLDRLIKDLCVEKDIIYEFVKEPKVYPDKIVLNVNTDFWEVAGNRIKNAFLGRVGEILANLIKSEKLDKEHIEEVFKTVVIKVMRLKEYDEEYVKNYFVNDENIEVLRDIRTHTEKHLIINSTIVEYLPIHKELLFVINKEKHTSYKALSQCIEYQFFTMALVNSLIRENIYQNTMLSGDDRGGYSEIINSLFFEGLRDIKHPGRFDIIKFVSQMFETIDYDVIHYNLTDMQTIVQKFHGVNLNELNSNKTVIKKLREDRDRLKNELLVTNKYITMIFELENITNESSRFMRYFSDSNNNSSVSLRYILKGLKGSNASFKIGDLDEIIYYVKSFLDKKYLHNMITLIKIMKSLSTKNTKEWAELKDKYDVKSFNSIMNKLIQEPIDYKLKKSQIISIEEIERFLSLMEDLKGFFVKDYEKNKKSSFEYTQKNESLVYIKQKGKIDKELTGLVDKLGAFFDYFDSCDLRLVKNMNIINGYRAEDGSFIMGLVTLFFTIFDNKHKNITERIKRIRLTTGYKSKVNIDNFYTLVKRIINYYKINHMYAHPLSNKPELLPELDIPPTHIEYIQNVIEDVKDGSSQIYFGENMEDKSYEEFENAIDNFYNENEVSDTLKKEIQTRIELYYQSKKEELIEKENLMKDNEFKVPERLVNPNEGLSNS